jgi:riboflavin kinase/FMN adenylyltransferase
MEEAQKTVLFEVSGTVFAGQKKATALGYPTANIICDSDVPSGIYVGEAIWKNTTYSAALYKEDGKDAIEAHLLDFSGNLYGETLTLRARHKIRDVKKFPNQKELIAVIAADIATIKKICSRE